MQDCVGHSAFRDTLLVNVWQAFNAVSETAVKVTFKSSILDMAQAREAQAAELLAAHEALAQSRGDAGNLEQALASVTGAPQHHEAHVARGSAAQRSASSCQRRNIMKRTWRVGLQHSAVPHLASKARLRSAVHGKQDERLQDGID
jgi:hypothetical protein